MFQLKSHLTKHYNRERTKSENIQGSQSLSRMLSKTSAVLPTLYQKTTKLGVSENTGPQNNLDISKKETFFKKINNNMIAPINLKSIIPIKNKNINHNSVTKTNYQNFFNKVQNVNLSPDQRLNITTSQLVSSSHS